MERDPPLEVLSYWLAEGNGGNARDRGVEGSKSFRPRQQLVPHFPQQNCKHVPATVETVCDKNGR